jgi:glycogen phosphorylase
MSPNVVHDPVCGMPARAEQDISASYQGQEFFFCSILCRDAFRADPGRFSKAPAAPATSGGVRRIAYFSMEVAIDPGLATYSGGLGVLAGDTLRSCADLGIPVIAVTLLHRRGYFEQTLDESGSQHEAPAHLDPTELLHPLSAVIRVEIEGRPVSVRAWEYTVTGLTGKTVPLLFLDTDLEENAAGDRELTGTLYGGDQRYRLAQEVLLGVAGVRVLRALGHGGIERFHLNEGHSALLVLELLREARAESDGDWDFGWVRERCVFTTHTPVPAGHDAFPYELVRRVVGDLPPMDMVQMLGGRDRLDLTNLALNASGYVNGVAKRHGEVSRGMYPGYAIDAITNGVHSATWTCESFARLYGRYLAGWRNDPFSLRYTIGIPKGEIWEAHLEAKRRLLAEATRRGHAGLRHESFTIGFARRVTAYKRADLVFSDAGRLAAIAEAVGPLQLVFAGKAHPRDEEGKNLIRRLFRFANELRGRVAVVCLADHDLELAELLVSGVDLWLNTPLAPLEASGTSGMKGAHNGVPSLSTLDGWWVEGHVEGVTGWSIGVGPEASSPPEERRKQDADDLYRKLGEIIVPMFYRDRERWLHVMRQTVAFNASFFNTHRMVQQYVANAYL